MTFEQSRINVLTQNVLLDKTLTGNGKILPQHQRIDSIIATLANYPASLDVVGIQEAHKEEGWHNGEYLANACGYGPGEWYEHNAPQANPKRGRRGEYMGMFGALVEHVEPIDIGDERLALLTSINGIAYVNYHLRSGKSRWAQAVRQQQAERIIAAIADFEDAVIFGDGNEPNIPWISRARSVFGHEGFESVFATTGATQVKTFPSKPYSRIRHVPRMRLDEISIRGDRIHVLGAGVLEQVELRHPYHDLLPMSAPLAGSDHDGLWATLAIDPLA